MEHRLPYGPSAPAQARMLAREAARGRLTPDRTEELVIMVSGTVSNAVRHGTPESDGRIGLRLESDDGVLRVAVTDGAPEFRRSPDAFNADRKSHHGLFVVDELADRWGLSLDGKKAVWFEVETGPWTP